MQPPFNVHQLLFP